MPPVVQIVRAEHGGQMALLLQNLQVQHDDGKDGEHPRQQVAEHEQHADILQVKAQKRRIAAEGVDAVRHQLRFVLIGDAGPPAVLHAQDGEQKDQIAEHADAESGEAGRCGQMAPAESDGHQLRGDDAHGGHAHQPLHCADLRVLSAPDLHGPDAAALLPPQLAQINAVKHRQNQQRQQAVGQGFFPWNVHMPLLLFFGLFPVRQPAGGQQCAGALRLISISV